MSSQSLRPARIRAYVDAVLRAMIHGLTDDPRVSLLRRDHRRACRDGRGIGAASDRREQ